MMKNSGLSCRRHTLEEVTAAVNRLSNLIQTSDPFLGHGPSKENNPIALIRRFTATRGDTFQNPLPLSQFESDQMVAQNFEKDLWRVFRLDGPLIPDALLKECKKRLLVDGISEGSEWHNDLKEVLTILDSMHRRRKASSCFGVCVYPTADWASLNPVPSHHFRKAIGPDLGKRFRALVIGNDAYPARGARLEGCINDALLIRTYLEDYLGVPSKRISLLTNATRKEMIENLYNLRDDTTINPGDNVFIHISGHGASYDPTAHFKTFVAQKGSIEAICPVDRGPFVPDISDRELNGILNEIRDIRKANITVFLDCCHGGGGVRSVGAIRSLEPLRISEQSGQGLEAMFRAADTNPRRGPNAPLTSSESWLSDTDDIVLMAGCHDFQIAREGAFKMGPNANFKPTIQLSQVHERASTAELYTRDAERGKLGSSVKGSPSQRFKPAEAFHEKQYGVFTWALVNVLKSNIGQSGTYENVIESIGRLSERQDPVVMGRKDSRLWFRN